MLDETKLFCWARGLRRLLGPQWVVGDPGTKVVNRGVGVWNDAGWPRGPGVLGRGALSLSPPTATPGCVCMCLLSCTSVCVNVLGALRTSCRPRSLRWWLVSLLFLQFLHPSHGQQQVPVAVTVCVRARGHLCSRHGLSQPTCGITGGSPGPQCPRESCSLPPPPRLACPQLSPCR